MTKTWICETPKTWTYSPYRAMLRKDGKAFAIVTPDGRNALSKKQAKELLEALNGSCALKVSWTAPKVKVRKKVNRVG
jgi:hypothetical protein